MRSPRLRLPEGGGGCRASGARHARAASPLVRPEWLARLSAAVAAARLHLVCVASHWCVWQARPAEPVIIARCGEMERIQVEVEESESEEEPEAPPPVVAAPPQHTDDEESKASSRSSSSSSSAPKKKRRKEEKKKQSKRREKEKKIKKKRKKTKKEKKRS